LARRTATTAVSDWTNAGYYEKSFRVVGKWIDEQKPRDIFFFRAGGRVRGPPSQGGARRFHHMLAEFTKDDIEALIAQAPQARRA